MRLDTHQPRAEHIRQLRQDALFEFDALVEHALHLGTRFPLRLGDRGVEVVVDPTGARFGRIGTQEGAAIAQLIVDGLPSAQEFPVTSLPEIVPHALGNPSGLIAPAPITEFQ